MNYLRKMHMLCIGQAEFEEMYKQEKQEDLLSFIKMKGLSFEELKNDRDKMQDVADSVSAELLKSKEEIEIFTALFGHLGMYQDGSGVCFILKDHIDPRKTPIDTLEKLKNSIKEDSITDFGIASDDGLRQFQLKQYKDKLNTEDLFSFIKKKINHYGKDLGNTNLLILLQSDGGIIDDVDFKELTRRVNSIDIKSDVEILISYNEDNKFDVINRVYPTLATCRKERPANFKWHSEGK